MNTAAHSTAKSPGALALLPCLPALRSLGDMADRRPCIVIDTREQEPLPIARLPVSRGGLYTGDYSVAGLQSVFAVERKSIADLVSCCAASNRARFEHELHRLRGFHFRRLLIVGTRAEIKAGAYRSTIKPAAVLGTLAAFEVRYDCPIVFEPDPASAARRAEVWAWYAAREAVETCNGMLRAG
jgi:DNA excision repair protein ERCC-4